MSAGGIQTQSQGMLAAGKDRLLGSEGGSRGEEESGIFQHRGRLSTGLQHRE